MTAIIASGAVSSSNTGYRPLTVDVTTVINPFKERLAAFNGRQHAIVAVT